MRCLTSISALIGLLISGYAPLRITVCHQMKQAAVCPRAVAVHHCDMPMGDDEEVAASTADFQSSLSAADAKCPMNCCRAGRSSVTTILPSRTLAVSLHMFAEKPDLATIPVKTNSPWSPPGRGPPSI